MVLPFLLELDGKAAGRFFEARGGNIGGEVAKSSGAKMIEAKHLDKISYSDIVIACGPGMSRAFYDWVGSSFTGSSRRMNGAVIALDQKSNPISRMNFDDALVRSLTLPKLDKFYGQPAALVIKIKPAGISLVKAGGNSGEKQNLGVYASPVAKNWSTSDFRIKIAGLESASVQVTNIQELQLGEELVEQTSGESRSNDVIPGKVTFPEITMLIPKNYVDPFKVWFKDSVVKGKSPAQNEKQGSLEYLAPGSASAYFTLKLNGLGMREFTQDDAFPTVSLYCNEMVFSAGSAAIR